VELSKEFGGKLLPSSHVITQHVRRVVSRILEANDLGTLRGDLRTPSSPPIPLSSSISIPVRTDDPSRSSFEESAGGRFDGNGNGGADGGAPDLWDPDADAARRWDSPDSSSGGSAHGLAARKEWNLMVVNDQKVVNAVASPGLYVCS
jgi:hypothetical protein